MAATLTEREQWKAELDALVDADLKSTSTDIHRLYASILRRLKAQLTDYLDRYDELSFSKRLEVSRLFTTAGDLTRELSDTYAAVADLVTGHITFAGTHGYQGIEYAMEQVEGLHLPSMGLDRTYLESLVKQPVAGATLSQRLYRQRQKLAKVTTEAIARGVVEGRGYAVIARAVTDATEASYRNSLRIVRTEAGRVRTQTTQRAYDDAASDGIHLSKRWVSTLDFHTRHDHRMLDGQTVPYDGKFTIEGASADGPRLFGVGSLDINCRCTTEPIVDGYGSTHRRDITTGDTIEYQTYTEWAASRG